jgi:hypothetical protein
MDELDPKLVESWERLKTFIDVAEEDVYKNARGNCSAGTRIRKAFKAIRQEAKLLLKFSMDITKQKRQKKSEELNK